MHFDALTLACVTQELKDTLCPGRIQNLVLPDEHSVGLEVYANRQRHYLLLSAHPQASRIHLARQKLRRGVEKETPLLLLLRKYARGALLEDVQQPDPVERVLLLRCVHPALGETTLVIEPMGRFGNLLLLDRQNQILDCLHRVPPGEHAQRILLPKRPYQLPPPQDKLSPLDDGSQDYYERLGTVLQGEGKLWRAVVAGIAGISPTLARELAWRAYGNADAPALQPDTEGGHHLQLPAVLQALQALWHLPATGAWQPGNVIDEDGGVVGFAPYELHFQGEFMPVDSISLALERFYAGVSRDTAGSEDPYAGMRGGVAGLLERAVKQVQRQLAALAEDEPAPGEPEELRVQAEWLLALAGQVEPRQEVLTVELEDRALHIPLDAQHSPIEQAERMFDRASKLERAAEFIPQRRALLQADLAFLAQLQTDLVLAQNQPEIVSVREELREAGYLRKRPRRQQRLGRDVSQPLRFLSSEGYRILVGRNARQNEIVTFQEGKADDLWLHVRDLPGAHVVVRSGGQPVSQETRRAAAQLAAHFSSLRGESAVPVAITQCRFVTRMAGGRPGQVYYRNEETVTVSAEMPEL
jgi:predicted ribosome quality control (RQC) complex YloA/Tae2 family protein